MNKRIDFTKLGGYPLAQEDIDWLQQSYQGAFAAMAGLIGDKVIISGMVEAGGNVSAGWISINNELLPFTAGAIGTGEFIIEETKTPLTFFDGGIKEVIIQRVARFSAGGPYAYADLVRIGTLKAFKALFDAHVIAYNAHTHAWAAITGKPAGYITYVGSQALADFAVDQVYNIAIPDQGAGTYIVAGSIRGLQADTFMDNDISWIVNSKTALSFKLSLREYAPVVQQLVFDFAIIKSL